VVSVLCSVSVVCLRVSCVVVCVCVVKVQRRSWDCDWEGLVEANHEFGRIRVYEMMGLGAFGLKKS
jgi:hypothetical protein